MLYKKRVAKSVFFITAIILSNTLIALLTAAHINYKFDANLITRIYDIWFLILLVFGIFYLPYHPKYYGLNLNKLKYNLIIGFGIGGAGMLIAVIIRLMLIKYGHDEFRFNFSALSIMLCVLYFFSCFLQEALSRGFFQSYFIAVFTKTRSNRIIAIFLTALVFAQFHYIYSSGLALASFIYCFSTGFIYEKTRSIAGITIIHFLIGASMIQFTFMK
jgi:membrane protease YdiL (CAAX protease family)